MKKPFENIEKFIKPFLEMQERLKPAIEMQKRMEHIIKIQKTFENMNRIYSSVPKFNNVFLKQLKSFQEIGNRLKEYEEKTPNYLLIIAQNGWYMELDCEMKFPSEIAKDFTEDKSPIANEKLTNYYTENLDRIFTEIISRHANRKEIFEQILSAFYRAEYYTIIPCILSQVDGICFDFTKKKFFIKEKDNKYLPQISSELEKSVGSFLNIYLSPLKNQTPIMVQEKQISDFPCKLNRHEILHGINVDYGTKENSLKVISLLKYISDLLMGIDEKY